MTQDILAAIIMATFAQGIHFAMNEGNILHWLRKILVRIAPQPQGKPRAHISDSLYACPRCMCSVWGIPAVLMVLFAPWWLCIPIYVACAVGIQEMIDR